ncbi:right-handed parallel beta-helix repeat-containing protein [Mucilaginibacter psychrotolerans]|uniref:Right-handed parallel beta-helix repeat-containing protein n=1 Tax=Mucilaginibacter psychrotolerans TaxID=1524096 RepID=A0A4Y8SJB3_9SPHI|nr:right-handed parallel beta-helix repeat-containing protein [Mucilaginibacter psychrotolerans]TFF38781.1 right-handed parallel beta-helix repeat-containing protein [Mucilaginibacter psychrotolerans]
MYVVCRLKAAYIFTAALLMISLLLACNGATTRIVSYRSSKPVKLNGAHDRVISGLDIQGDTLDCLELNNCYNITVKNCRFRFSKKNGIILLSSCNIKVVNCYFEKLASGVYAVECRQIDVSYNNFRNIQGPFPRGQMVQFDEVIGPGSKINYNNGENVPGQSAPEDAINVFKSAGTPASPIQVIGNRIRGGGPSTIGGGIMLGDNGGAYIVAKNNILVNPGQYGMAIAGGNHISIINNTIYGKQQKFTNVGLYIWKQHTSGCSLNTMASNHVNFTKANGKPNAGWNQGNCGKVAGWDTNIFNAKIDASILPGEIIPAQTQ